MRFERVWESFVSMVVVIAAAAVVVWACFCVVELCLGSMLLYDCAAVELLVVVVGVSVSGRLERDVGQSWDSSSSSPVARDSFVRAQMLPYVLVSWM